MEPDTFPFAGVGDRADRIDRGARRRSDRRNDCARAGEIERLRAEPELIVCRRLPELQLEQPARLVDRGVRVLRADDDAGARPRVARGRERRQRRDRCPLLDVAVQAGREPEQLRKPVEGRLLELLERRRGAPEDADVVEPRDQQLGESSRAGAGGREVGEEPRALPVRETREDDTVEVFEHARKRLRLLGRRRGQCGAHVAGRESREHGRLLDALLIAREPVDRGVPVLDERHRASTASDSRGIPSDSRLSRSDSIAASSKRK